MVNCFEIVFMCYVNETIKEDYKIVVNIRRDYVEAKTYFLFRQ